MQCGRSHRSPDLTRRTRTMLLSCGDALVDFLPVTSVDGRDAAVPVAGGSCLNIAVGMARLGAPAGFVGGISTDLFGRIIADHALGSRVDLRYATRSEHQTTLAFVRHVGGEPQYAFYDEATACFCLKRKDTRPLQAKCHCRPRWNWCAPIMRKPTRSSTRSRRRSLMHRPG